MKFNIFKPERFTGGVPSLYLGITDLFFKFNSNPINNNIPSKNSLFYKEILSDSLYFDSARSSLFFIIEFYKKRGYSNVVCCGYTCDAVIDSIVANRMNIQITEIDIHSLKMVINDKLLEKFDSTHILIIQNSFGVPGLDLDLVKKIKSKGSIIISDNSLSIGSEACVPLLNLSDYQIYSLEVSKSFTIGWGGGLYINTNLKEEIAVQYNKLSRTRLITEVRMLLQLFLCKKFQSIGRKYYILLWGLLKLTGIIRKSGPTFNNRKNFKPCKFNLLNKFLLTRLISLFDIYYNMALSNTKYVISIAKKNKIEIPSIYYRYCDEVITPRVPIFTDYYSDKIINHLERFECSTSIWFNTIPSNLIKLNIMKSESLLKLYSNTFNIPCYLSLRDDQIKIYVNVYKSICND